MVLLAAGIAIGTLNGCGSGTSQSIRVSGKLAVSGHKPLPKAATARVSMIERSDDGGDKRIVAERTLHDLSRKPIAFNIDVARNLINPDGRYGLRAEIVGAEGRVLWHTLWPVEVKPLTENKVASLELRRVLNPGDLTFRRYRCADGFHLDAARAGDAAVVRLGKRRLVLSADQTRDNLGVFLDEHGNRLEQTGTHMAFRVDGTDHNGCQPVAEEQSSNS